MEQEYKGNDRRKTNVEHICTKEETIDAVADDMARVKGEIMKIQSVNDRTIETLDRMETKLNSMDKRLFIDNGVTSVQTTLKNNENRIESSGLVFTKPHLFISSQGEEKLFFWRREGKRTRFA